MVTKNPLALALGEHCGAVGASIAQKHRIRPDCYAIRPYSVFLMRVPREPKPEGSICSYSSD